MSVAPVLAAVDLAVTYRGGSEVLAHCDLQVRRGTRLAVLGANGSGKTTLLRSLSGAIEPTRGSIEVDGVRLRHSRSSLVRHRTLVQLVLQDPDDQLFSADVRQDVSFGPTNLGLPHEEVDARVDEVMELMEIAHLADRPIHYLSFGQRKRVAIAGAVAMRPSVLLLDEPTAGLDPRGVDRLMTCLDSLEARGTTVVISTHDIDLAWAWAREVAVVAEGQVRQRPVSEALTDRRALVDSGLRVPWQVQVLEEAGLSGLLDEGGALPRTAADVVELLRGG